MTYINYINLFVIFHYIFHSITRNKTCNHLGKSFDIGESYLSDAHCNICTCLKNGNFTCITHVNCRTLNCHISTGINFFCCFLLNCSNIYQTTQQTFSTDTRRNSSYPNTTQKTNHSTWIICIVLFFIIIIFIVIHLIKEIGVNPYRRGRRHNRSNEHVKYTRQSFRRR